MYVCIMDFVCLSMMIRAKDNDWLFLLASIYKIRFKCVLVNKCEQGDEGRLDEEKNDTEKIDSYIDLSSISICQYYSKQIQYSITLL